MKTSHSTHKYIPTQKEMETELAYMEREWNKAEQEQKAWIRHEARKALHPSIGKNTRALFGL